MDSNANIDWRALLEAEVAKAGKKKGKAAVAIRLNVSRAYVSRVMNPDGKSGLKSVPQEFIDRVIRRFHVIACPARGDMQVAYTDCAKANQPAPSHNPLAVMLWRKCQTCPHKPEGEKK